MKFPLIFDGIYRHGVWRFVEGYNHEGGIIEVTSNVGGQLSWIQKSRKYFIRHFIFFSCDLVSTMV